MRTSVITSLLLAFIILFISGLTSGCGSKTYYHDLGLAPLEENWGRAYHEAKYRQIINPTAQADTRAVEEMDGKASESSIREYRKGFGSAPEAQVYNLNLGSISGIGE